MECIWCSSKPCICAKLKIAEENGFRCGHLISKPPCPYTVDMEYGIKLINAWEYGHRNGLKDTREKMKKELEQMKK